MTVFLCGEEWWSMAGDHARRGQATRHSVEQTLQWSTARRRVSAGAAVRRTSCATCID
jgi:hypothetical protein